MSWRVEVKPSAEKQYLKLSAHQRKQVLESLKALEAADNPFLHPGVRALTAGLKGDYRLRVGNLRVLYTPERKKRLLHVYAILPRGKAY